MQGREDNSQVSITRTVEREGFDRRQIGLVGAPTHCLHRSRTTRPPNFGQRNLGHGVHQGLVLGRNNLPSVAPVYLVAVVFFGVVGGRDYDSGGTTLQPHRETQFRGRAKVLKKPYVHAVGSQNVCGNPRKFCGLVARIISNGHGGILTCCTNHIGQALGRKSDGVAVHSVAAEPHEPA